MGIAQGFVLDVLKAISLTVRPGHERVMAGPNVPDIFAVSDPDWWPSVTVPFHVHPVHHRVTATMTGLGITTNRDRKKKSGMARVYIPDLSSTILI